MDYLSKQKKMITIVLGLVILSLIPSTTIAQTNNNPNEIPQLEQPAEEDIQNEESLRYDIPNIDQARVEAAWIEMINEVRSEEA